MKRTQRTRSRRWSGGAIAIALLLVMGKSLPGQTGKAAAESPYLQTLRLIARDITALKGRYPQLAEFSGRNVQADRLAVVYSFHAEVPRETGDKPQGGWTRHVPNPAADGLWLYIDFHDPNSTLEIHTQPMTAPLCFKDKRVSFLILEGSDTEKVGAELQRILEHYGVTWCPPPASAPAAPGN